MTQELELKNLILKFRQGDGPSYAAFLQLVQVVVRGFLLKRLKNKTEIDDIIQEILLGVHKALSTYDESKSILTWLFSITRYKLIDYWRRKNHGIHESDIHVDDLESFHLGADEVLILQELMMLLDLLPEREQMIVREAKIEGSSIEEISVKYNLTPSNVKVIIHRGLKSLRQLLDEQ